MSDIRFTMLGVALIFVGFIVLGVVGSQFDAYTIEAEEFEDCFEYSSDAPPKKIDCDAKRQDKFVLTAVVVGLIAAGIILLIKGVKGRWDQDVKPEDMVGPGGSDKSKSD